LLRNELADEGMPDAASEMKQAMKDYSIKYA
jgi:hypothetical protein